MSKKPRLGADPLGWIKDSRDNQEDVIEVKKAEQKRTPFQKTEKNQPNEVEKNIIRPKSLEKIELEPKEPQVTEFVKQGRPKVTREPENASQRGLRDGWTRATFILREEFLEMIKDESYWDRKPVKDIFDDLMKEYFKEKKVKPRPKRSSLD